MFAWLRKEDVEDIMWEFAARVIRTTIDRKIDGLLPEFTFCEIACGICPFDDMLKQVKPIIIHEADLVFYNKITDCICSLCREFMGVRMPPNSSALPCPCSYYNFWGLSANKNAWQVLLEKLRLMEKIKERVEKG